jgi:hypothetical protein
MKQVYFIFLFGIFLIGCTNSSQEGTTTETPKMMELNTDLASLFEDIIVVKMHLFSTADPTLKDYPYIGKPIATNLHQYLDESLLENAEMGLFATYKVQNQYYVLRVPSREFSNELVLCRLDESTGKLKKVEVLANGWCRTERCHQQDAWLADLDLDQQLELIIRSRDENKEGKIVGNLFRVKTEDGRGGFVIGKDSLANPTSYVLMEGILPMQ